MQSADAKTDIRITGFNVRTVLLQISQPLETASGSFNTWPVILLDVHTDANVSGHAYVGVFMPMMLKPIAGLLQDLGRLVTGDALSPMGLNQKLRARTRLLGVQGPLATAIALIEIAAWDALGKAAALPVSRLLGSEPRAFPMYQTLVAMEPAKAAELACQAIAEGYGGVKLKLGHPTLRKDVELINAVREVTGDDFPIMGDYNQVLTLPEAIKRISVIDGEGLIWIEEPTAARDYEGHARIAAAAITPVQCGENWTTLADAADSLRAGASDYVMPDVVKIGGVSAWIKAATLAESYGVPVSAHSFPEICAQLISVIATGHWLEHVGMADAILQQPIKPSDGLYTAGDAPGFGIEWNEDVIARSLVQ